MKPHTLLTLLAAATGVAAWIISRYHRPLSWRMRQALLCLPLLLVSCAHITEHHSDAGPSRYQPWARPPGIPIQDALNKTMESLKSRGIDVSRGYVLEVGRSPGPAGKDCWLFDFHLLPSSPDYVVSVRVYDSGDVEPGL